MSLPEYRRVPYDGDWLDARMGSMTVGKATKGLLQVCSTSKVKGAEQRPRERLR